MNKGGKGQGTAPGGRWDTEDILFDPISTSTTMSKTIPTSRDYSYDFDYNSAQGELPGTYKRHEAFTDRPGRFQRGAFRNIALRRDEDASHFLPDFAADAARILAIMQIIMGSVIILIGIFAYVAKATVGPLIPAMDMGCSVVLYITGGVLGMFAKCRAKRIVAAFMILSACSILASIVLGSIHSLAAFRTSYICAYLHCQTTAVQSPRKVMDALIAILSFLEAVFAFVSLLIGFHGFCKNCDKD